MRELFLKEIPQGTAEILALSLKVGNSADKGWLGSGLSVKGVAVKEHPCIMAKSSPSILWYGDSRLVSQTPEHRSSEAFNF